MDSVGAKYVKNRLWYGLKQSREDMSYKTTVIASWVMIVGLGVTVEKAGMSRI